MPKVIDNVRGRAIEEARAVLLREGYDALTIRQIAGSLGIGLGTFYNYFPSKEYLAAGVMLEDWQLLTQQFEADLPGKSAEEVFRGLFALIRSFVNRYFPAWKEYEQHGSSRPMITRYHRPLVDQLAGYLQQALPEAQQQAEPYLAGFLAETVLRFASDSQCSCESIEPAIRKLIRFQDVG